MPLSPPATAFRSRVGEDCAWCLLQIAQPSQTALSLSTAVGHLLGVSLSGAANLPSPSPAHLTPNVSKR